MKDLTPIIEKILPAVVRLRQELHAIPELRYEEHETSRRVLKALESLPGLALRRHVAGTGIAAVLGAGKRGPCIALRADMDALPVQEESGKPYASRNPGFMHACGHDGHMACLVGTAMALYEIADELAGPVKFLFQPAEEQGGGAARMCAEGALEEPRVDAIFGMHGWPDLDAGHVGICKGSAMASNSNFSITVHGKGAHAATPHAGIDPIMIASQIVSALQTIVSRSNSALDPVVLSVTMFHAGTTWNVIPSLAVLNGTLRVLTPAAARRVTKQMTTIATEVARAFGGSAEVKVEDCYPALVNDSRAHAFFAATARDVLGSEAVNAEYPPLMASEDFAFYGEKVPSAYWFAGLRPAGATQFPLCHHPQFDFSDAAIPTAIRLQCELARRFATGFPR